MTNYLGQLPSPFAQNSQMGYCQSKQEAPPQQSRPQPAATSHEQYDKSFAYKKGGTALLIIDPQVDFHEGGSLQVAGATADSTRTARMIQDHMNEIHQISVTLDSHLKLHIANPFYWMDGEGKHPPPFTPITEKDINEKKWVWPEHCLIGTPGHNVVEPLNAALQSWSGHALDIVNYVNKVSRLLEADRVLICGQALSHCVQFTTRDLLANWPKERLKDVWLIEDQCSPVGGFEKAAADFVADMRAAGVSICKTENAFAK